MIKFIIVLFVWSRGGECYKFQKQEKRVSVIYKKNTLLRIVNLKRRIAFVEFIGKYR